MLSPADQYFLSLEEPVRGCMEFLRKHILTFRPGITENWQYGMPFYLLGKRRICYLWVHKKIGQPYLGIVDGKLIDSPELLSEKRSRMKIFLIDPGEDIPISKIDAILGIATK